MSAETKIISTLTETIISGIDISIKTSYVEDILPDTLLASISDTVGVQDGVSYVEGELLIRTKNNPDHLNYSISSNGELILLINTGDENKYSVNANGELIYTT